MPKKWGIPPNIQKRSSDSGFSLENPRQGVDRALTSVISKTFCKSLTSYLYKDASCTEIGEKFRSLYKNEFGGEPRESHYAGADAYLLILDVLKKSDSLDAGNIREALSRINTFDGMTGKTGVNRSGPAVKPILFRVVKRRKSVFTLPENLGSDLGKSP